MENPFLRNEDEKYIFPSIKSYEVAKYIESSGFLQKREMTEKNIIGMHPTFENQEVFYLEMLHKHTDKVAKT